MRFTIDTISMVDIAVCKPGVVIWLIGNQKHSTRILWEELEPFFDGKIIPMEEEFERGKEGKIVLEANVIYSKFGNLLLHELKDDLGNDKGTYMLQLLPHVSTFLKNSIDRLIRDKKAGKLMFEESKENENR